MGPMQMNKTGVQPSNMTDDRDIVYSGDEAHTTTGSMQDIDIESTTQSELGARNPASGANLGVIFGIIISTAMLVVVLIYAYRRHKHMKKRHNSPYHVPIIEYREENPSISTYSSPGYGTYRNLEECPIIEDYSTKIEGKLTLQGLHANT